MYINCRARDTQVSSTTIPQEHVADIYMFVFWCYKCIYLHCLDWCDLSASSTYRIAELMLRVRSEGRPLVGVPLLCG